MKNLFDRLPCVGACLLSEPKMEQLGLCDLVFPLVDGFIFLCFFFLNLLFWVRVLWWKKEVYERQN